MKRSLFLAIGSVFTLAATHAQENEIKKIDEAINSKAIAADTSKKGPWKFGGTVVINLSQQNSAYWVGANERYALSVGSNADLYGNYVKGKNTWDNTLKMSYSWINNQSQGVRKTSDFIDFFTKYGRDISKGGKMFFATIGNLRTQFSNGYDYNLDPRRRTSGFFAPATVLFTPGLEWRPQKAFSVFVSPFAARWVIVSNDPFSFSFPDGIRPDGSREDPISLLYGVDPYQKVDAQFGAFLSANFNRQVVKNITYTSRLDLYSNYKNQPQNIDIFWTNNLVFKVNKWIAFQYQWNIAYDHDFVPEGLKGPRTQFLGNFGVGVTGKF
jgi:hypothetical protein